MLMPNLYSQFVVNPTAALSIQYLPGTEIAEEKKRWGGGPENTADKFISIKPHTNTEQFPYAALLRTKFYKKKKADCCSIIMTDEHKLNPNSTFI